MLAIVIPYYKIHFFEATLQSLALQTDKRFKVYIGNDASSECPCGLLEKFKRKIDFEYQYFENNLGSYSLAQQWERCVAMCTNEEWVMLLGDDDVLGHNVVESFYLSLKETASANVFRFASCKLNEFGHILSNIYYNPPEESSVSFLFREKKRNSLSEYIFRRSQIITIGFKDFPLAWCTDILAVLEFSNFDLVYSINEAIVYIRISTLSISGDKKNTILKNVASEAFSSFIIFKKFEFFNKRQRLSIIYGYEVAIKKNRKIKKSDWNILFKLYLENFNVISMSKFLRRSIIDLFSSQFSSVSTN